MSSQPRLTPTSYIVLGLVEASGEATPYDLKRTVAKSLGNFWSLPHAQLYAEPKRLAAAGLLEERREGSGRRRKYYRLTRPGEQALGEWRSAPTEEMTELRDLAMLKIFFGANPEQMAAAQLPARRHKLEEYERVRELIAEHAPEGVLLTLEAGIDHERAWVRFWSGLAGEESEPG